MPLKIENVNKNFKENKNYVLKDINLTINDGEFICLLGPSGCGKSTLLNIIAGLDAPTSGTLTNNDKEIKGIGGDRAVMFQESALFPWLKVIDNVEFGMKMKKVPKGERREKARNYLRMVHLAQFENHYVHQLSGGMKQRVALARALTLDSEILLMDEPFSALDSQIRLILQSEIQRIWKETKKTIIFVTHDVEEAVILADRIIVLSTSPGMVKKEFKIDLPRPRTMENTDAAYYIRDIMKELKEEVNKIAKSQFDGDWDSEESSILPTTDNSLGTGI